MVRNVSLLVAVVLLISIPLGAEEQIRLWPGVAPGETKEIGPERTLPSKPNESNPIIRLTDVSDPILTIYRPAKQVETGTAVIVCPGGGYSILAYNHEGSEICEWLNSLGVTAALLKYRVPRRDPETPHVAPLKDAQRAMRILRGKADELGINAARIGMLGFSAGGHLTVMAGTHFADATYEPIDEWDKLSPRPDFLIPIYPAYLVDKKDGQKLDPLVTVSAETPPTFMAITYDDADRAIGTALFLIALKQHKVPCELHVFHKGGHGYGMRPSENPVSHWPDLCRDWMRSLGLLPGK